MSTPTPTWNLGTVALNGRDGDTIRDAGAKYNAHRHFSTDIENAIQGAAAPSAANPFATIADVGSGGSSIETVSVESTELVNGTRIYVTHSAVPMDESRCMIPSVLGHSSTVDTGLLVQGPQRVWNPVNYGGGSFICSGSGVGRFSVAQGVGCVVNARIDLLPVSGAMITTSIQALTNDGTGTDEVTLGYTQPAAGTYQIIYIGADNGSGGVNYGPSGYPEGVWYHWTRNGGFPTADDENLFGPPVVKDLIGDATLVSYKFSFDNGVTWKYWNGTAWTTTTLDASTWETQSCKVNPTAISTDWGNRYYNCRYLADPSGVIIPESAWPTTRTSTYRYAVAIKAASGAAGAKAELLWDLEQSVEWKEGSYNISFERVSETKARFVLNSAITDCDKILCSIAVIA